ncbi:uncharacterized protein KGF55_005564 [Candida pseudojiufengensis]|uniref:uncharacterized protein n=1 Tax=Candida pseudojiufengensis TaxID=497109 RepID=UPI002224E0F7|nr:uncharacterized protein KGF55_005564 [Candida pseudojiufengensis]KAI5959074.1 hypothetical protein KGF55_005564 [Candida pseudojiufengensis]
MIKRLKNTTLWSNFKFLQSIRYSSSSTKSKSTFNTIIIEQSTEKQTKLSNESILKLINRLKNEKYIIDEGFKAILVSYKGKILQIKSFGTEDIKEEEDEEVMQSEKVLEEPQRVNATLETEPETKSKVLEKTKPETKSKVLEKTSQGNATLETKTETVQVETTSESTSRTVQVETSEIKAEPVVVEDNNLKPDETNTTENQDIEVKPLTSRKRKLLELKNRLESKKLLAPTLKFQKRAFEYDKEAFLRKIELESQFTDPHLKGFKFLNYDKLIQTGVGSYEFLKESKDMKILLRKQNLIISHPKLRIPELKLTQKETLNFENATSMETLEIIGKSLIDEWFYKWNFFQQFRSKIMIYKFENFANRGLRFIKIEPNKDMTQIIFSSPIQLFISMHYLEDKNYYQIIENFTSRFREINKIRNPKYDLNLLNDNYLELIQKYTREQNIPLQNHLFSQTFKPQLLTNFEINLPCLPKLKNQFFYNYFQIALIAPFSITTNNYPEINFLSQNLDAIGDCILKRYTGEFLINYSKSNPNFKWNMEDHNFLNSNILFSRLSLAYKLHQGLNNLRHQKEISEKILISDLNISNEYLGDIFERIVGIFYLDDYENCRNWIFNIYSIILKNITAKKDGIEFIDKEKYVKLYQYHLKNFTMY